jgi:hypothetical protein
MKNSTFNEMRDQHDRVYLDYMTGPYNPKIFVGAGILVATAIIVSLIPQLF